VGSALTATDMEVGLRNTVPADVKKKGSVTLNARKLYEIVREMTADEVVLRSGQAGWVEVLAWSLALPDREPRPEGLSRSFR
jgi:DNA polymerase-3 subunit beta